MFDKKLLPKISDLKISGGKVVMDCYDPQCPFLDALKVGERPLEIKYSEESGKFVGECVAYNCSSNPCDVVEYVLGDLELELGNI